MIKLGTCSKMLMWIIRVVELLMIELMLDLEGKMICNLIQIEQTAGATVETTQSQQDQRFSKFLCSSFFYVRHNFLMQAFGYSS